MIALANAGGWPATLFTYDLASKTAAATAGIWYHVRVSNDTRWFNITGVHIFLLSMEAPDASGKFQTIWEGYTPLGWKLEPDPKPKIIGYPADCDLCHVINDPRQVRLSPLIKGQVPETFTSSFRIAVTLQARGIEADSDRLRIEISWDGEWSDNRDEMMRHLVVKAT